MSTTDPLLDEQKASGSTSPAAGSKVIATFQIGGMTCGACVETIERMIRSQPGIDSISVALLAERATVTFDDSMWSPEKVAEEIEDTGFDATFIEVIKTQNAATRMISKEGSSYAAESSLQIDTAQLNVYGMTCASCSATIEREMSKVDGIKSISVSLSTEKARIEYDSSKLGIRDLVEHVEDLGFDAVVSDDRNSTQLASLGRIKEIAEWRSAFLFSLSMGVPVFLISMVLTKFSITRSILWWQPISGLYLQDILCLALTIPVQFGIGLRFYRTSWKALKHGSATMDVLIVIGTTASWVFSVFSMIARLFCVDAQADSVSVMARAMEMMAPMPGQCTKPATFFDTTTMLFTFVSFGRFLENTAKGKTSEALSRLIGLTPSSATIYADGAEGKVEKKVSSELVQRGDYVKVVPGERIVADGIIVRGESTVDESMVTGEAIPIHKLVGSSVIGGTVNGTGTFDFLVQRAGKDTSLAQIVKLVDEAQTSKAPIQAFADRVAGYFVPTVVGLGAFTFIAWMVIAHLVSGRMLPSIFNQQGVTKFMVCLKLCISVIVVACPCALGLSTPTAVMVGTGVGAQNGILIKGGGPLEASTTIRRMYFDKTGTLTQGKLTLREAIWSKEEQGGLDAIAVGGLSRRQAIRIIGAAEARSEHPLARAIALWAARQLHGHSSQPAAAIGAKQDVAIPEASIDDFESFTGKGIACRVELEETQTVHVVRIGTSEFVYSSEKQNSHDDAFSSQATKLLAEQQSKGRTAVLASIDGSLAVVLSLSDTVKPEARQTLAALSRMGIRCGMMTGDATATARALARELGLDETDVHAEMSPIDKQDLILELRRAQGGADLEAGGRFSPFRANGQAKSCGIAMVGDGINDSPALASADLGIALGTGSDVAIEAASIVLMRSNLLDVAASIHLSRRIFRQIKLNFIWATIYNMVSIPLAMGIFLPWGLSLHPMMAGAAMAFSSVSVVASSLTLKWYKRPAELTFADGSDEAGSPPLTDSLQMQELLDQSDAGAFDRVVANLKDLGYQFLGKFESAMTSSSLRLGRGRVGGVGRTASSAGYEQVATEAV